MFCPKCGNQMPDGAAFCPSCGMQMNATGAQSNAAMPTPTVAPAPAAAPMATAVVENKPRKSKLVPIVAIAAVLLCLAGVFASGILDGFLGNKTDVNNGGGSSSSQAAGDETSSESSEIDYSTDENADKVGTWKGKLTKTTMNPACYGAQQNPLEITVHEVDSLGKITMDIKVLLHAHRKGDADADSNEGDVVMEYTDLVTTLQGNKFSLTIPKEEDIERANDIKIDGSFTSDKAGNLTIEATVDSGILANSVKDEFELTKVE